MPKPKDKTFQVRVDEDTLGNAQETADDRGISLGALVRALFKKFASHPDEVLEDLDVGEASERAEYDHRHARKLREKPKRRRY